LLVVGALHVLGDPLVHLLLDILNVEVIPPTPDGARGDVLAPPDRLEGALGRLLDPRLGLKVEVLLKHLLLGHGLHHFVQFGLRLVQVDPGIRLLQVLYIQVF